MSITGGFVGALHIMEGKSTDNKPDKTIENTFFFENNTGKVYYYSEGEWAEAGEMIAKMIAYILGKGGDLPIVTGDDNGKVLGVSNGAWAVVPGGGGGSDAIHVVFTLTGGVYSCNKTPTQIAAALTAGTPIALQIDGNYSGFLKSADQYAAVFYMYDMDDHWPNFRQFYLEADGTVTISEFEPAQNTTIENVSGSTPSIDPIANTIYQCGEISSLTVGSTPVYDDFTIRFTSGSTATTFSAPSWMIMPDDFTIEANRRYEINVSDGYAAVGSWAVSSS